MVFKSHTSIGIANLHTYHEWYSETIPNKFNQQWLGEFADCQKPLREKRQFRKSESKEPSLKGSL